MARIDIDTTVDVDIEEILGCSTEREKIEALDWLLKDLGDSQINKSMKDSQFLIMNKESVFNKELIKLSNFRHLLSVDEESVVLKITKRFV